MKSFVIKGSNNKDILCDLRLSDIKKSPIIIFSHGFKGFKDWGPFNFIAEFFKESNFSFLKFNFSHNGTTIDDANNFSDLNSFGNNNLSKELFDLNCVIDWVEKNLSYTKIILMGHSRGAGISLLKASTDNRISKVISLASVSDFNKKIANKKLALWKEKGVAYVFNSRTNQQMPIFFQFYEDLQKNLSKFSILKRSKKIDQEVLLIHGDNDKTVNVSSIFDLFSNIKKSKKIIVKDADHVFNSKHPFLINDYSKELKFVLHESLKFLKE